MKLVSIEKYKKGLKKLSDDDLIQKLYSAARMSQKQYFVAINDEIKARGLVEIGPITEGEQELVDVSQDAG